MLLPLSPKGTAIRLPFTSKSRQNQLGGLDQILVEESDDSQPHVLFAGKPCAPRLSLSSLSNPTRLAKKRKLVVSGIALNDTRRLDAIQKWCRVRGVRYLQLVPPNIFSRHDKSFGEVDQITRMPNGDLHIDFQRAEVADTVRTVLRACAQDLIVLAGMSCARQSLHCRSRQCTFILDLRKQTNIASTRVVFISLLVCKGKLLVD